MTNKIHKILEALKSTLILLLIILPAPLFGGRDTTSIFLIRTLILFAVILLLIQVFLSDKHKKELLSGLGLVRVPLVLFFLFVSFSIVQYSGAFGVFTKFIPGSVHPFETKQQVIQLVFYFLFFILCLDFFSTQKKIRLAVILLALEVVYLVALGHYQINSHYGGLKKIYGVYDVAGYVSFFSSFFNTNHYGCFLLLASFLFFGSVIYWLRRADSRLRSNSFYLESFFYMILLPVIVVSMFQTKARAAFFIEILALASFWFFSLSSGHRFKAFWMLIVFAAAAYFFVSVSDINVQEFLGKLRRDVETRLMMNKESLKIFFDYPLFGTGLGTYKWISRAYQITHADRYWWTHVHNDYVELLTDSGCVGFILFALFTLIFLIQSLKNCLNNPSRWARTMGIASFAALVALGILSATEFYIREPAIALLMVLQLVILLKSGSLNLRPAAISTLSEGENTSVARKTVTMILFSVFFIILMALFKYSYFEYISQNILDNSQRYLLPHYHPQLNRDIVKRMNRDLLALQRSVSLAPDNPRAWSILGDAYYDEALSKTRNEFDHFIELSIESYQTSAKLAPTWPDAWLFLGRSQILAKKKKEGFKNMEHAIRLNRYNRDFYLYLIIHYLRAAEHAPWPEEKEDYRKKATSWIHKTMFLKQPLNESDYDFTREFGARLNKEDRRRIEEIFKGMRAA